MKKIQKIPEMNDGKFEFEVKFADKRRKDIFVYGNTKQEAIKKVQKFFGSGFGIKRTK